MWDYVLLGCPKTRSFFSFATFFFLSTHIYCCYLSQALPSLQYTIVTSDNFFHRFICVELQFYIQYILQILYDTDCFGFGYDLFIQSGYSLRLCITLIVLNECVKFVYTQLYKRILHFNSFINQFYNVTDFLTFTVIKLNVESQQPQAIPRVLYEVIRIGIWVYQCVYLPRNTHHLHNYAIYYMFSHLRNGPYW